MRGSSSPRRAAAVAVLLAAVIATPRADGAGAPPPLADIDSAGVLEQVRSAGGRLVLVNVWATWCRPCLEELPDLLAAARHHRARGVRLLLVSADFPDQRDAAAAVLARLGADVPAFLKAEPDMPFIERLAPEWTGALPATLLFDGQGRLLAVHEGRLTRKAIDGLIAAHLVQSDADPHDAVRAEE